MSMPPRQRRLTARVGLGRRFVASMGRVLVVLAAAALLAGCGSHVGAAGAAGDAPPRRGGTVWMESAQEPPLLNSYLAAGGMSITDVVTTPLKSQWIQVDDRGRWQPVLATTVPTMANGGVRATAGGGMRIDFAIDVDAVWSDGVPITCADLRFTWQTLLDPKFAIGSRIGWQHVTGIDCPTAKSATIWLDEPFAPYLSTLLATAPLPRHVLRGADFDTVWNNRITVSSGPFVFRSWTRGDRIVLERNPRWWRAGAEGRPYLDRVVIRFVPDSSTMKLDLRMEDADIIGLPPDTTLPDELADMPSVSYDIQPGAGWENLTFNTARFPFDDARVRRAAAYAIDRDSLVDVVLRGQVPRLDATLLPSQKPYHHPVFDRYRADPTRVRALMTGAGFTRDGSGAWQRDGRAAKVVLTTTIGNPLRLKAVQLVAAQLDAAGFAPEILMARPEVFFASIVTQGRYDIAMYSFSQGLDPSQTKFFACSEVAKAPNWAGKNNFKYCRPGLDTLLADADRELDVSRRAALTREIAERIATDVPTLPLYQQPDTLAWNRRLQGVRPNGMGRHLWNIDSWWVTNP